MIIVDYRTQSEREKPTPEMQRAIDRTCKKIAAAFSGRKFKARLTASIKRDGQ